MKVLKVSQKTICVLCALLLIFSLVPVKPVKAATQITITYDAGEAATINGGTVYKVSATAGVSTKITTVKPVRPGCNFLGWTRTKGSGQISFYAGMYGTFSKNTTFWPVWNANIAYAAGDGKYPSGAVVMNISVTLGVPVTIPSTIPSRTGYSFEGWTTVKGSSTVVYKPNTTATFTAPTTLWPVWKELNSSVSTTSVTIDRSGGSKTVTVNPQGRSWTISKVDQDPKNPWVTATKNGNNLTIKAPENTNTVKRTAKVYILVGGKTQHIITVSQEPNYHKITLKAGEGAFSDGSKTKTIKAKHGSIINDYLKNAPKATKVWRKLLGYSYKTYSPKNYQDSIDVEAAITSYNNTNRVYSDITLTAHYWIDLSNYKSITKTKDYWRWHEFEEFALVVLTIYSNWGENDVTDYDSLARTNHRHNSSIGTRTSIIFGQEELSQYKIDVSTMDDVGCGIVACHNARLLMGKETELAQMIYITSQYRMLVPNHGSLNALCVPEAVNYSGSKLTVQKYNDAIAFDLAVQNDLQNMKGKQKNDKVAYILCMWNGDYDPSYLITIPNKLLDQGGHYVCFVPDYDDPSGYLLKAYNYYGSDTQARGFNSVSDLLSLDTAYTNRFILGFRITLP